MKTMYVHNVDSSMRRKRKEKFRYLTCNLKADWISLVYHINQTKKDEKRDTKKKTDELIKYGNSHKNLWDPSEKKDGGKDLWKK